MAMTSKRGLTSRDDIKLRVVVKFRGGLKLSAVENIKTTGKLRYLEFQENGENTLSFPKFEIANNDVRRIHVHEQKCVH